MNQSFIFIFKILINKHNIHSVSGSTGGTAKHGRRSSVTMDLYKENSPKYLTLKSDYVVPKLDGKMHVDAVYNMDAELEQSWKSLSQFEQSHKGRLALDGGLKNSDSGLSTSSELISGKKQL